MSRGTECSNFTALLLRVLSLLRDIGFLLLVTGRAAQGGALRAALFVAILILGAMLIWDSLRPSQDDGYGLMTTFSIGYLAGVMPLAAASLSAFIVILLCLMAPMFVTFRAHKIADVSLLVRFSAFGSVLVGSLVAVWQLSNHTSSPLDRYGLWAWSMGCAFASLYYLRVCREDASRL